MKGSTDRVLAEAVRQLVLDHVDSFEKLEALMLLSKEGRGTWTVRTVSVRLRLPQWVGATVLDELRMSQLLEVRGVEEQVFRYAPATEELAKAVQDLAQIFERDRVTLIKFMAKSSIERVRSSAIRTFADAFVARESDDAGKKHE